MPKSSLPYPWGERRQVDADPFCKTQSILEELLVDLESEIVTLEGLMEGIFLMPDPEKALRGLKATIGRLKVARRMAADDYNLVIVADDDGGAV